MASISMLPQTRAGEITLQAQPAVWRDAATRIREMEPSLKAIAQMIDRTKLAGPVVRIAMPEQKARDLLAALGLAH